MTRWLLPLLALLIALHGAPAAAQMACGTRADMVRHLEDEYGETRRGFGLAGPMVAFEVWANSETGTWTLLRTHPNGVSCFLTGGEGWQDDDGQDAEPPTPGEPT